MSRIILPGVDKDNFPFVVVKEFDYDSLTQEKRDWLCNESTSEVLGIDSIYSVPVETGLSGYIPTLEDRPMLKISFQHVTLMANFIAKWVGLP